MSDHVSAGSFSPPESRLDAILTVVIWALFAAVIGFGAYFGYTVWATKQQEMLSTPALRTINELKGAVRQSPGSAPLRVRLGEAMGAAKMTDEAIRQLSTAVKLDPKHTGAYLDLGLLAVDKQQLKTAEGYFTKVIELTEGADYESINARRETALYYLGLLAFKGKRYEDAVGYYKGALRIRRDASDTYYNMALAYRALDRDDAALEQLNVAIMFDPSYAQALYEVGLIYREKKDDVNAASNFAKAAKLAPSAEQPAEALSSYGTVREWMGRAKKGLAAKDMKKAVHGVRMAHALDAKDVAALELMAKVYEAAGDREHVVKAWLDRAAVYLGDDDWKSAVGDARKAVELDPKNVAALKLIAEAYELGKDRKNAAQAWQNAAKIAPRDPAVLNGLARYANTDTK